MKNKFLKYQAQTSPHPLAMEVSFADGSYIYDNCGNKYLDFVAGVSACTLGHQHPKVKQAIIEQLNSYWHVMVYGEYIQQPAVEFCQLLANNLPEKLSKTYLVNSGTEAIEGALKLAKRVTGRAQLISCFDAYHGNTMGSMSVMGNEDRKKAYQPLLADVDFIRFNCIEDLVKITEKTAAVILESIQGGAGFLVPENGYLTKVRQRCDQVGAMMILDEIQPGFGRTGKLFGFMNYQVVPDVLVMGKGMASGMPVGAFSASKQHMDVLSDNPKFGHITTFGGHPVIAAAALATLQELLSTDLMAQSLDKEQLFRQLLRHPLIKDIRGKGLMLAVITDSEEVTNKVIAKCQKMGLILFWLLFDAKAIRITPPLTITDQEIVEGCKIIISVLEQVQNQLVK